MAKKKTDNPDAIPRANVKRETTIADNFASLYANDTQLQLTPWDIRLVFGVVEDGATIERPTNIIKQVGEVRMSLHHAKRVAQLLVAQIERFERASESIIPVPE